MHVSVTVPLDLYEFLNFVESPEDLGQWCRMEDRIGSEENYEEMAQISLHAWDGLTSLTVHIFHKIYLFSEIRSIKCLKHLIDYFDAVAPDLLLQSYSFQRLRTDGCNLLNQISVFGSDVMSSSSVGRALPPKPLVFFFLLYKWVYIISLCYCDETPLVLIKDVLIKKRLFIYCVLKFDILPN